MSKNHLFCHDNKCKSCFYKSFASQSKAKYWSDKNEINPRHIRKSSGKIFKFDCECGHEFEISLRNVTTCGKWCSYCVHLKLCDDDNCVTCFNKSFASHAKSKYWSKDNDIKPRNVFKSSSKKYKFDCKNCGHEFYQSLNDTNKGTWCPYCSVPSKLLCDDESCDFCFDRSFASHEKSIYWSSKNKISPRDVLKTSNNKYIFDCICEHEFTKMVVDVALKNTWCPYCSNLKLCQNENCDQCYNNSFASHKISKYWSKKNKIKPRFVFKSSNKKFEFDCPYCNELYINRLATISRGQWCSCRRNKTETILYKFLKKHFNNIIKQKTFRWCKNKKNLPFDFCVDDYKIIIELDGDQHFNQVSNWKSPTETQKRDIYKMQQANLHDYTVIRLLQQDIWANKNPYWKNQLLDAIRSYNNPINLFLNVTIGDLVSKAKTYEYITCFYPRLISAE